MVLILKKVLNNERKLMKVPNTHPTLTLEELQALTAKGLFVFPVHGIVEDRCTCGDAHEADGSAGKHPVTSNGMDDATQDERTIAMWHDKYPSCNWAVNLKQSGLMVFDLDPRNGGDTSWDLFEAWLPKSLGNSWVAVTGAQQVGDRSVRGTHLYYKVPNEVKLRGSLGKDSPGVDIKHNGYVLLAGSRHISGVCYGWLHGRSPSELEPAELSEKVLALLTSMGPDSGSEGLAIDELQLYSEPMTPYGRKALHSEVEEVLFSREGARNSTLFNSGLKIGSLISGGEIPFEEGVQELVDAAVRVGLSEEEAINTLIRRSGGGALQLGAVTPRGPKIEASDEQLEVTPTIPEIPTQKPVDPSYLNLVDWGAAFEDDSEEVWLVPGVICDERSHAIYADAGLGKSLLVLEICAALASGKSALGLPALDPMKVLYFDHENTVKGDVVPRLRRMGYKAEDLSGLIYSSFPEMDPLDTSKGGRQLLEILDRFGPRLVIIDTVSRTISGDENSNSTWLDFYTHAGKVLKSLGIAYIRIDHSGKNADAGMRGGSAKKGDVDLIWNLTGKSDGTRFGLTCEKSRVPLPSKELELMRHTSPTLRHEIHDRGSTLDWKELVEVNEKFTKALALIDADQITQGSLKGQKDVWKRVSRQAKKAGIGIEIFREAHRAVKSGYLEADYELEDLILEDE